MQVTLQFQYRRGIGVGCKLFKMDQGQGYSHSYTPHPPLSLPLGVIPQITGMQQYAAPPPFPYHAPHYSYPVGPARSAAIPSGALLLAQNPPKSIIFTGFSAGRKKGKEFSISTVNPSFAHIESNRELRTGRRRGCGHRWAWWSAFVRIFQIAIERRIQSNDCQLFLKLFH